MEARKKEPLTTDTLLLNRAMDSAMPEDYVDWALERLCEEVDSPSLRILAGLNMRFERDEVEAYFQQTCKELNIQPPAELAEPRETARLVKRVYDQGEMSAEAAVHMMATLYQKSNYSDPVLWIWYEIEEELALQGSGHEGCFYPADALAPFEDMVEREWSLFFRASRLDLPEDFFLYIECSRCGYIGAPQLKHRTLSDRIKAAIPWFRPKPPAWHSCSVCGSCEYRNMMDPGVRDAYFKQIEGVRSTSTGG